MQLLYDFLLQPSLAFLTPYAETPPAAADRPAFQVVADSSGFSGKGGTGNFTAWRFKTNLPEKWTLKLLFTIPAGVSFSNSGVFLLRQDPTRNCTDLSPEATAKCTEAKTQAVNLKSKHGPGPWELVPFSHEIQIYSNQEGVLSTPDDQGAGAFYGVPLGQGPALQQRDLIYWLFLGEQYELTIEQNKLLTTTRLRATQHQSKPVLISTFEAQLPSEDPARGGPVTGLALQAYWNNEGDVRLPVFQRIELLESE